MVWVKSVKVRCSERAGVTHVPSGQCAVQFGVVQSARSLISDESTARAVPARSVERTNFEYCIVDFEILISFRMPIKRVCFPAHIPYRTELT